MLPSAPRSRVYPQLGFSVANWTTRRCSEAAVPERPLPRRAVPSYLFAMSSRYQRRIVSGVTRPPSWSRTRRPSALPLRREPAALGVGEAQALVAELLAQNAVLLLEK